MTYRSFNTLFCAITGYCKYSLNCYQIEKLINHPERLPENIGQSARKWDDEITDIDMKYLKNHIAGQVFQKVLALYKLRK